MARRAAIANGQPQQMTVAQAIQMQPVGAIRVLQIASITPKPSSPIEGPDHGTVFGAPIELHLKTLGDTDLILMQMTIEGAEHLHDQLGQSIGRARRQRDGDGDDVQTCTDEAVPGLTPDDAA